MASAERGEAGAALGHVDQTPATGPGVQGLDVSASPGRLLTKPNPNPRSCPGVGTTSFPVTLMHSQAQTARFNVL